MISSIDQITEDEISHRLSTATDHSPSQTELAFSELLNGPPRFAAVLIPLLRENGAWHMLFTRRNAHLAEHSGQVAFPGGQADSTDPSLEYTALREAQEEIGLNPSDVRTLGRLRTFHTITNYLVTPIIGIIPWPYPINISEFEVSRVFTIPLRWLADPKNYHIQFRQLPEPAPPIPVVYFNKYHGELLWGASAQFTLTFLKIIQSNGKVSL